MALLLVSLPLAAHHSFAPHFDATKRVDIAGVVTEFEKRNPHAYVHLKVQDADGRSVVWRCESHGVTQLTRNGITPEMLAPGKTVRLMGSQHRRVPNECFFDSVQVGDGEVLSVDARGAAVQRPKVAQRDSIFGTWLLLPSGRATSGPQSMMDYTNAAAKAAIAKYNPFTDDPTYRCEPVAIRRGWFAPDTPMAIRRQGNDIVIQHEWMDIERVVHMDQAAAPAGTPEAILGYSRGHWDGDTLVVETDHFKPGVLNQFVEVAGQPMRGLLHSNALRTVERIRFDAARNVITLSIEHYDPEFFTRDFPVVSGEYAASDLEIKHFGCIPEQLK
ncbi:MAG: hypothetical protein LBE59_03805 [Nevskiaceae bacterium]|jgi:hypothetical protein|nr:hypothetical protein [Nevskiaceae bacterium]